MRKTRELLSVNHVGGRQPLCGLCIHTYKSFDPNPRRKLGRECRMVHWEETTTTPSPAYVPAMGQLGKVASKPP